MHNVLKPVRRQKVLMCHALPLAKIERIYPLSRPGNIGYECGMTDLFDMKSRVKSKAQVETATAL